MSSSTSTTSAAAVLVALLSSVAAYVLGAVVLPYLSRFARRDRALKKLNLPTPEALNFNEKIFGTMARFDPTKPANYCRTVMQVWQRECGEPPLLVSRGLDRHLVIVLDPGAATSVSSFFLSFFRVFFFLFFAATFFSRVSISLSLSLLLLSFSPQRNRSSPAPAARRSLPRPTLASTSSLILTERLVSFFLGGGGVNFFLVFEVGVEERKNSKKNSPLFYFSLSPQLRKKTKNNRAPSSRTRPPPASGSGSGKRSPRHSLRRRCGKGSSAQSARRRRRPPRPSLASPRKAPAELFRSTWTMWPPRWPWTSSRRSASGCGATPWSGSARSSRKKRGRSRTTAERSVLLPLCRRSLCRNP